MEKLVPGVKEAFVSQLESASNIRAEGLTIEPVGEDLWIFKFSNGKWFAITASASRYDTHLQIAQEDHFLGYELGYLTDANVLSKKAYEEQQGWNRTVEKARRTARDRTIYENLKEKFGE